MKRSPINIIVADDDADDRLLIADAFEEARLSNPVEFVKDGQELLDFLNREGDFADRKDQPLPGLILLDLNMPRKDGKAALKEIRADDRLRRIPVIILTTSKAEEEIFRSYDLGANSFITKPVTFDRLCEVVNVIGEYWFELVSLPTEATA